MSFKVLIPQDITDPGKDYLKEHGCEIEILDDHSVENICKHVVDADAILARTADYPAAVFEAGKKLKVIARHGAGVDNFDIDAATAHGVWVCRAPIANSNSVAEHTMMMILACAKNTILQDKACRAADYNSRNRVKGMELEGKVLGLIGCGHIGQLVAKKAAYGFGMKVVGYDAYADPAKLPDYIELKDNMDDVYKEADFVSLHVPLNDETRGMVNKDVMEHKMKNTAYVINCARGGIVDEKDLYDAVTSGAIAGAGLDVFVAEIEDPNRPLDPECPLFKLDKVVVSPHNAALTKEAADRMGLHAAQGIIEVLTGKVPTWPVNKIK